MEQTGIDREEIQKDRFVHAVVGVSATVAALAILVSGSAWGRTEGSSDSFDQAYVSRIWREAVKGDEDTDKWLYDSGFKVLRGHAFPDWIGEICDVVTIEKAFANEDMSIMNVEFLESESDALSSFRERLKRKGWVEYESGLETVASYVKERGECRWLLVEIPATGGNNVVLHIRHT